MQGIPVFLSQDGGASMGGYIFTWSENGCLGVMLDWIILKRYDTTKWSKFCTLIV